MEESGGQQEGDQTGGVAGQQVQDPPVAAPAVEAGPGLLRPADPRGGGGAAGVRQALGVTSPPLGVLPVSLVCHPATSNLTTGETMSTCSALLISSPTTHSS